MTGSKVDKKEFYKLLQEIKYSYINWKFDLKNNEQVLNWFNLFKEFSLKQIKDMTEEYIKKNSYPPNSPYDLLQYKNNDPVWMKEFMEELLGDDD